jgi:DNA topoisomerase-1
MELIIAEKEKSAKKIAETLNCNDTKTFKKFKIFISKEKDIVVGHVSGHCTSWSYGKKYKTWSKINLDQLIEDTPICTYHTLEKQYFTNLFKNYKIDKLSLFTDKDSEGELIAKKIADLGYKISKSLNTNLKLLRYKTSALTKKDIIQAIKNPDNLDYLLANSSEAKHFIDLQWGSSLTILFTLYAKKLYTIGRVQTPVLNLLVEKTKTIDNFKPSTYIVIKALSDEITLISDNIKEFNENLWANIKNIKVVALQLKVTNLKKYPPKPLNTTDLMKFSSLLNIDSHTCMKIAESLYLKGLITYPRTDSRWIDYKELLNLYSNFESSNFEQYEINVGNKDLAHPCIKPTGEKVSSKQLSKQEKTLYNYIYSHYLNILKGPTIVDVYHYKTTIEGIDFNYIQEKCIRLGFKPVIEFKNLNLSLKILDYSYEEKTTKPPKNYSESSLIKKMEDLNIGTKSTRHTFLKGLRDRDYVKKFTPTLKGLLLINILKNYAPIVTSATLTSSIENKLTSIQNGTKTVEDVLTLITKELKDIIKIIQQSKHYIIKQLRKI